MATSPLATTKPDIEPPAMDRCVAFHAWLGWFSIWHCQTATSVMERVVMRVRRRGHPRRRTRCTNLWTRGAVSGDPDVHVDHSRRGRDLLHPLIGALQVQALQGAQPGAVTPGVRTDHVGCSAAPGHDLRGG